MNEQERLDFRTAMLIFLAALAFLLLVKLTMAQY
jgi:hypothetical protein